MVVIRYFWVNLEASYAGVTAATVRKYDGWDGVLVSIPWGAGEEALWRDALAGLCFS